MKYLLEFALLFQAERTECDVTINISIAEIYMWIRSNALYIKYYAYLITYLAYTAKNAEPAAQQV
jgi:hypothetical protein